MKMAKRNRPEAGTSERVSETAVKQYTDDSKIIVLHPAAEGKQNFHRKGGAFSVSGLPLLFAVIGIVSMTRGVFAVIDRIEEG